ncbi:Serine protease [Ceratobasidium sp. AG-Ba]|nr:Serine protease [Ceratobasidium sp. AG-Ba]
MRLTFALGALAFVIPALGVPTRVPITKRAGRVKPRSYIVSFKDAAHKDAFVRGSGEGFTHSESSVTHDYDIIPAATIVVGDSKDMMLIQGAPGVESIEHDGIVSLDYEAGISGFDLEGYSQDTNTGEPQSEKRNGLGTDCLGAVIYVIDTGLNKDHQCFGGRATWGASFINGVKGDNATDENGHGTHTASTAGCDVYGVARGASIIGVKVLGGDGSGSNSDVISGINWAHNNFTGEKQPAVLSMSLGGLYLPFFSKSMTDAVNECTDAGLHTVIAAGNSNQLVVLTSPANVKSAVTVGAVDAPNNNQKASFSNYGKLIDIWAPGVGITAAWIGSNTATNTISGTSMATPYVAGVLAVSLCKYGQMSPAELTRAMKGNSTKNAVTFALQDAAAESISTHDLINIW